MFKATGITNQTSECDNQFEKSFGVRTQALDRPCLWIQGWNIDRSAWYYRELDRWARDANSPTVLELQVKKVSRVRKGKCRFDMDEGSVNSKGQLQSTFRVFRAKAKLAFWCLSLNCQTVSVGMDSRINTE